MTLGLIILFLPVEAIQTILNEKYDNPWETDPWMLIMTITFLYICFYFLLKKHLWAPFLLLAIEIISVLLDYVETGKFSVGFLGMYILFYSATIQSIYFLRKEKVSAQASK